MLRALSRKATAFRPWARGLKLLPRPDGSLTDKGPAAGLPAILPSPYPQQPKEHGQPYEPPHPWQVFTSAAAAARQRPSSRFTLSGRRTIVTTATAGARRGAAKPSTCQDKGSTGIGTGTEATIGDTGSSPAQPCPLHACLLRYGITDLAAFSTPKHLALSQEVVSSNVEPKLAALAAEGLSQKSIMQIMKARRPPLWCNYTDVFQVNLQLLRQIGTHTDLRPHPRTPHLTAAGKTLAGSPAVAAIYLSRDPGKVQQLLQWLEGSLGIGSEQLAACKGLCHALILSAGAAGAVCLLLKQQQVPAGQVAQLLLKQPTLFSHKPDRLSARLGAIQQHMGLDAAAALHAAIASPSLLTNDWISSLPALLHFLDDYMGEEGAGRRLVFAQRALCAVTAAAAERGVRSLAARGYSQQDIRHMVSKQPNLLIANLDSPLQQQKLHWIERVSPWTVDDFLSNPTNFLGTTTRRLAARLALLRECKLHPYPTPGLLALYNEPRFMRNVNKRLARQGRELPWTSWAEWEDVWLGTEEGREWGYLPLKG